MKTLQKQRFTFTTNRNLQRRHSYLFATVLSQGGSYASIPLWKTRRQTRLPSTNIVCNRLKKKIKSRTKSNQRVTWYLPHYPENSSRQFWAAVVQALEGTHVLPAQKVYGMQHILPQVPSMMALEVCLRQKRFLVCEKRFWQQSYHLHCFARRRKIRFDHLLAFSILASCCKRFQARNSNCTLNPLRTDQSHQNCI